MSSQPFSVKHSVLDVGIIGLRPFPIFADDQPVDVQVELRWKEHRMSDDAAWVQAEFVNRSGKPVGLKGIRWGYDSAGSIGPALHFPHKLGPSVWANENLRGDYFGTGTVEGDRFACPLTNQHVEYGNAEEHLFPGVFIAAESEPVGVLVAQASQDRFYALYRFRGRMERRENWLFEIEERVNGITHIIVPPDGSVLGEKLFVQVVSTRDPQHATGRYFQLLRELGVFARRPENPLPKQRIYCTWNYDFFADIDQEKLLGQIPVLKEHFPIVKFLQLDDGYQTCHEPGQRAMIDLCYGDLKHSFDPTRFPDGPESLTKKIKAAGLRPAIWLGLWASTGSRMLKDHPDWILRDDTGTPLTFDKWYGGVALLDPSIDGVREYLDRMCATVFGDWGFEGVKLDFSSFAFNGKRVRYRQPGKSGVELRHEVESIFRRHLPRDGFFGWCVVAGTSQVFLKQADYFRNAIDVGKGEWPVVLRIAHWTANTNLFLQERPCLPNLDSIGWSEEFADDVTWQTWLNFCAVDGGALEVSGDLRRLPVERLKKLAQTMALSDPSRVVRCLDLPSGSAELPPSLWLAKGGESADQLLGVFNWSQAPATIDLRAAAIKGPVRDAWTGAVVSGDHAALHLPPRASVLWRLQS